ncbi:hypothetical protein [Prosthecochloris sp. ZM]|uniref:hypothetical protein n=1 Tax=Prosthecochloris sp. ZM TaxID=2283143 RepID=UPI001AC005B2|nr:hypothetical protein [Prosthecochloris sp. ZM]
MLGSRKTPMENLARIYDCKIETIQDSTFLEVVTETQKRKLFESLQRIATCMKRPHPNHLTLTFRGDNSLNLTPKLTSSSTVIQEHKLVSLLFYFGDKAKHFYEFEDEEAKNSRWITRIEDHADGTAEVIFNKIKRLIKSKNERVVRFCARNPAFESYFKGNNKEHFVKMLKEDKKYGRDYYLYLLHTAGKIGIGNKSLLVSTSRSYNIAELFAGEAETRYIIFYIIPSPIKYHAVSHTLKNSYEQSLKKNGLPIYEGASLYPDQNEVAIKGALFSHHILGMMVVGENRFIANPHLFKEGNSVDSFSTGLNFDQSNFEKDLCGTGYKRGVGTFLDGYYHTVKRT